MKIDMSKATVEWLEAWKAKKLASPQSSFYRNIEINEVEAKRQYLRDKLDVYFQDFRVGSRDVIIYVSDLNRDTIRQLYQLKIVLPDGVAVLDYIDTDTYYEPYCEDPSTRLEVTFAVPKT